MSEAPELSIGSTGKRQLPISIREADQGDVSFIFSSWLKSFRGGAMAKYVENTIYFSEHHKLVERLLKRSKTVVACNPEDPATIYGYLCYEIVEGIFCVHYGYTKQPFRVLGVLRQLLHSTGHDFARGTGLATHQNQVGARMALKYNLVYHPYILLNY